MPDHRRYRVALLALALGLVGPGVATAQAPPPPSLCRTAYCTPGDLQADRRLAAAWRAAWAATSRPVSLLARGALWQRDHYPDTPGTAPRPWVAPETARFAEQLTAGAQIDVALRAAATAPAAPLESVCFGQALRRCEVLASGSLDAGEGAPSFVWQTQFGFRTHVERNPSQVEWGGSVVLVRDGTRLRPVIWSFVEWNRLPSPPVLVPREGGPMLFTTFPLGGDFQGWLVARLDRGEWRDIDAVSWFETLRRGPRVDESRWPRVAFDAPSLTVTMREPPPYLRTTRGPIELLDRRFAAPDDTAPRRSLTVTLRREGDALIIADVIVNPPATPPLRPDGMVAPRREEAVPRTSGDGEGPPARAASPSR